MLWNLHGSSPGSYPDLDGLINPADLGSVLGWIAGGYNVRGDFDLDGDVDSADQATVTTYWGRTLGWGVLSHTTTANRKGYAGYELDWAVGSLYHVRHRVLHTTLGRWITRDPLGYVDGMNLFALVTSKALTHVDPYGTMSAQTGSWGPSACKFRWRRFNVWSIPPRYHLGVDIEYPDLHTESVDYGYFTDSPWLCCAGNKRYPLGPDGKRTAPGGVPGWHPSQATQLDDVQVSPVEEVASPVFCDCMRNDLTEQYSKCCEYSLFGWPGHNSNGAIRVAVQKCEQRTGITITRQKGFRGNWLFPGWNNVPTLEYPSTSPPCP